MKVVKSSINPCCRCSTGECFKSLEEAEECNSSLASDPDSTPAPERPEDREGEAAGCREGEWKCFGGACVTMDRVCDGTPHCGDEVEVVGPDGEVVLSSSGEVQVTSSDESGRAGLGCNRFGDRWGCPSRHGRNFSRCGGLLAGEVTVCTDEEVEEGLGLEVCRRCQGQQVEVLGASMSLLWRCNNGQCIQVLHCTAVHCT